MLFEGLNCEMLCRFAFFYLSQWKVATLGICGELLSVSRSDDCEEDFANMGLTTFGLLYAITDALNASVDRGVSKTIRSLVAMLSFRHITSQLW